MSSYLNQYNNRSQGIAQQGPATHQVNSDAFDDSDDVEREVKLADILVLHRLIRNLAGQVETLNGNVRDLKEANDSLKSTLSQVERYISLSTQQSLVLSFKKGSPESVFFFFFFLKKKILNFFFFFFFF